MAKHTSGTWTVTSQGYVASDAGGYVPIVTPFTPKAHRDMHGGATSEAIANARLFAASKDLLGACMFVVNDAEPGEDARLTVEGYNRLCAAIAKATGLALLLLTLTGCATTSTVVVRHDLPGGSVDYVATIHH